MEIGRQAIEATLVLSAPMLLTALIIGLVVSIFQAATQINEQTLSFIPKIVGVFLVMLLAGPWMLSYITEYFQRLYNSIPGIIG
jgi:flagellar biosynthetic protein FliQ